MSTAPDQSGRYGKPQGEKQSFDWTQAVREEPSYDVEQLPFDEPLSPFYHLPANTLAQKADASTTWQSTSLPPAPPSLSTLSTKMGRRGLLRNRKLVLSVLVIVALLIIGVLLSTLVSTLNSAVSSSNAAKATATAGTSAFSTQQKFYRQAVSGKPALTDPLDQPGKAMMEVYKTTTAEEALFFAQAYHIREPNKNKFTLGYVQAATYTNFALQVDMSYMKGDWGGIVLRSAMVKNAFYYLRIGRDGTYQLLRYRNASQFAIVKSGETNLFHTGLEQNNTLVLIVQGASISFYCNQQFVDSFTDATYTTGNIGFAASSESELAFKNLRIWNPNGTIR